MGIAHACGIGILPVIHGLEAHATPRPVFQARCLWIVQNIGDRVLEVLLVSDQMVVGFRLPDRPRSPEGLIDAIGCKALP